MSQENNPIFAMLPQFFPAGALEKIQALQATQMDLFKSLFADTEKIASVTEAPSALLQHVNKYQTLMGNIAKSHSQSVQGLQSLAVNVSAQESLLNECFDMQVAICQRLAKMGKDWVDGVTKIAVQAADSKHVNTLDKLVEGDMNAVLQLNNLLVNQTTALTQLAMGIQVGLGLMLERQEEKLKNAGTDSAA